MKILLTLSALFIGIFFLFTGNGLFMNSASVKLNEAGMSNLVIGAVNTCFFLGATLSAVAAHRVISRVGHVRSFSIFAALFAIGALLHIFSQNIYLWSALRLIQGFCYYGLLMVVESWLNEKSPHHIRSRVLAIYEIVFYLAFSSGVLLMSLDMSTVGIFVFSAIFITLATIPIGFTRLPEPNIPSRERISFPKLFNITPLALTGSFLGGIMINGFFSMGSIFILHQGFSLKETSYFITSAMIGGFAIQLPVGKLSDAFGRRKAILGVCSISLFSSIALIIFSGQSINIRWQYILGFFLGCGIFTIYSLSLARANDVVDTRQSTLEVSRSLLFSYGIGALIAPLSIGAAMHWLGHRGFGVIFAICSLILWITAFTQRTIPKDLLSTYVSMPGNLSELAGKLDPRNDQIDNTNHNNESFSEPENEPPNKTLSED